jgi:hypothetical protein
VKNAIFFRRKWAKIAKNVIITSTPGHPDCCLNASQNLSRAKIFRIGNIAIEMTCTYNPKDKHKSRNCPKYVKHVKHTFTTKAYQVPNYSPSLRAVF